MRAHAGESRPQQRRIHVITGETAMSSAKAEPYAKRKLGLVTGIATLCMIALADAAAQGRGRQISAGRAAAIHECSVLASRYSQHDWGNVEIYQYRACMARHGEPE